MKKLLKSIIKILSFLELKLKYGKTKCKLSSLNLSKDIKLGKKVRIGKNIIIRKNVSVGDYSYFNTYFGQSYIDEDVEIGKYCSIAPNVCIALGSHNMEYVTTSPILYDKKFGFVKVSISNNSNQKKTIIKNDVWIGANANIKKGITIGNGAVVAMNSVVTKDVPDYAIVAGNPARIIRYRFSEQQIKKLLESKWWERSDEEIEENIDKYYNIDSFLKGQ